MAEKNSEHEKKVVAGLLALGIVLGSALILAALVSILIAMVQAGFINLAVWITIISVTAYIVKKVYNLIINKGWVDGWIDEQR